MARTRRLWISDVVVSPGPGGFVREPVTELARRFLIANDRTPFPCVWVAPRQDGPQLFIGVAGLSDVEATAIHERAADIGASFLSMSLRDTDLTSAFGLGARNVLNPVLIDEGIAAVRNNETKVQAITRIVRALRPNASFTKLRDYLIGHPDVDPEDRGVD